MWSRYGSVGEVLAAITCRAGFNFHNSLGLIKIKGRQDATGFSRGEGGPGDGQTKITESDNRLSGGQITVWVHPHAALPRPPTFTLTSAPGNFDHIKMCKKFSKNTKKIYLLVKFASV